jgi:hypothetical protein
MRAGPRTFALSQVGAFLVGIDASEILSVGDGAQRLDPAHLDVARVLGADVPDGTARRLAHVRGPVGAVLLGTTVHLATPPRDACQPPPVFVAPALVRRAIEGLVALPDGFAYILALDRLPRPAGAGLEVP